MPTLAQAAPAFAPALPACRTPLPDAIEALVWRGTSLGTPISTVVSTGFDALDKELPGGGWPCHSLTELLQTQPAALEWRLLAPALRGIVARGQSVIVVGPPQQPHLPGLRQVGIDERHLVWVQTEAPAERLWCTEQLVKSNAFGALIAWLPQARPEQIRRLQICAQSCEGPVFLCRPASARHQASAAPLRVQANLGVHWELAVEVVKRRGPASDQLIRLPSIPGALAAVLTPRVLRPAPVARVRPMTPVSSTSELAPDALGSTVAPQRPRRPATLQ